MIAAGEHPSPFGLADIITTTTHKTLRGARGGLIFCKQELASAVDGAVFPGTQGGALQHVVASKAVTAEEACTADYKDYIHNVVVNTKAMCDEFKRLGLRKLSKSAAMIKISSQKKSDDGVCTITGANANMKSSFHLSRLPSVFRALKSTYMNRYGSTGTYSSATFGDTRMKSKRILRNEVDCDEKYVVVRTINGAYDSGHIHESGACTMNSSDGYPINIEESGLLDSYEEADILRQKIIKQEMDNLQSTLFKDTDWYLSVFNSGTSTILVQKELNKDAKPFEVIEDENQILVKTYQQVITEWLEVVDILVIDV